MIETIIVMSILAIGLISLYASYALIMKRNANNTNDKAENTYIAYQINNYKFYQPSNILDSTYYVEVYSLGGNYLKRDCGLVGSTAKCTSQIIIPKEEQALYRNLNIDKIYYFTRNLSELFNSDALLLFDGSTINYLNKQKNNINVSSTAERTVLVKTKYDNETNFSYYQKEYSYNAKNIRRLIYGEENKNVSNPMTNPGVNISSNNEKIIGTTIDDYGISYYFRGNVQNNYLVFAGMCWRIVRVTGNGNIKLVLYNESNASCTETGENKAFARYSTNNFKISYNSSNNYNTYVGYKYSNNTSSSNYNDNHANNIDSNILAKLKMWYDSKISDQNKLLLADVIWCNDKSVVSDLSYNVNSFSNLTGSGVKNEATYYSASRRLMPSANAGPSLNCTNSLSKLTSTNLNGYKIGLLTADEVAYAGGAYNASNNNYYLYNNATGNSYWTMTPAYFNGSNAYVWAVTSSGALNPVIVTNNDIAIRPVVSLLPTINIIGSGTSTDPYKVID